MLNMIKMDLYRLVKTKSMYVIWAIMALAIVLTTAMGKMELDRMAETDYINENVVSDKIEEEDNTEPVNLGMTVNLSVDSGEKVTVYQMVYANMKGKFTALFIVIFAVIFATADMNSGYIKNIGGQVKNRGQLVLSKALSVFVYTVITLILFALIQAISNGIFFGYIEWGKMREFLLYFSTETLLHFALAMICMTIAIILRSNVVSMIISVLLCMNVLVILYGVVNKLVYKIGVKDFNVINYTVTGKMSMLSSELTNKDSIGAVCISIVFIVIMSVFGGIVFEKRDI